MTASSTWHSAKEPSAKVMRNNRINECDIFMVCSFWFGLFANRKAFTEGSEENEDLSFELDLTPFCFLRLLL
jgi:hypothetical protein